MSRPIRVSTVDESMPQAAIPRRVMLWGEGHRINQFFRPGRMLRSGRGTTLPGMPIPLPREMADGLKRPEMRFGFFTERLRPRSVGRTGLDLAVFTRRGGRGSDGSV